MIRVLVFCEFGTLNGGEHSLLAVLPRLLKNGIQPVVAVPSHSELDQQLLALGVETLPWNPQALGQQQNSVAQRREIIQQLVDRVEPDLVHANSLSMTRLSGPVARRLGIASLGHLRDMMNISQQGVEDLNCHRRLLAVSRATRDWYLERGVDGHRLHVLYNGVDLEQFCPGKAQGNLHRELELPAELPILGGIGQIGLRKGWEVLLQSLHQVRRKFPQVHLTLVGERHSEKQEAIDYQQHLKELAGQDELQGHVHFLGRRGDVTDLLKQWTMLIHPARQEPLGRVLLEAAASGCPVVATDVGGTREIFPDDQQGALLVPAESPEQLANAICRLLAAPEMGRLLGETGRQRAEAQFAPAASADQLQKHYQAVASSGQQQL